MSQDRLFHILCSCPPTPAANIDTHSVFEYLQTHSARGLYFFHPILQLMKEGKNEAGAGGKKRVRRKGRK
jgi:hypothetical protein